MSLIEKTIIEKGLAENKSLAKIVQAGARGTPSQYRGTIATQGIVVDAEGRPKMDIPIKNSYAEGLSLPEYLTTAFGTRTGEVLKKISVAQGGYGSKQFARALMGLQVTEADCETANGITVSVTDNESVGAYLAKGILSYNRNNEVTLKMLNDLKSKSIKEIIIRSPMTCQANKKHHSGGLCQMCVGRREKGIAAMDSYVGLVAGTAVAEPLTESAMKARHSGGAATSLNGQSGFKLINQLANIPKKFVGKAPLAQEDGFITKLEPAAAGGYFIGVNNEDHYISIEQEPIVKVGDRVEQGQVLSTGLVDPSEVVKYRGIGDGRKYYMEAMKQAFDDSNLPVNRRNFELIAKAAIDHVRITDPEGLGDFLPEQIASYSAVEKNYEPRESSKTVRLDSAYGKYLEKPELHYTIGTRITSAVIKDLKNHEIESVLVNDQPPNFEPVMVRLVDIPEHHEDWMHVLNSTNLAKRFINMVNKGAVSDVKGPSPIPGLAYGVDFGKK
jgi:DNA-directed RNA polymerase subunit beta'